MNAMTLPSAIGPDAPPFADRIWVRQSGRSMAPAVRHGDWVWLAPVSRYEGEGIYLLEVAPGQEDLYRVTYDHGTRGVLVHKEEECWERYSVNMETFNRTVRAKTVLVAVVLDPRLLDAA